MISTDTTSRWASRRGAALMALLLVVVLWLPGGCSRRPQTAPSLQATPPPGLLQEVPPPLGVQQLAEALAERNPQLRIVAPADGASLPAGPWSLQLNVNDWPISDAGELGLGAHVVVQLDDQVPLRLTGSSSGKPGELKVDMPPLSPGSHRLTAYAARPWGEAVKSPGAFSQIRLQRVAPTPLRVPAEGSPQLIAVSPGPEPRSEPVLLDWLLVDAPLQGLREGDASWRLRVTVNGDSFLVDRNTPLWLRGWKPGSNSLQLDLVDGLGDPLNPPFNSQVAEVVINSTAAKPAWQQGRLDAANLARLLGQRPTVIEPELGPEPQAEAPQPQPAQPPQPLQPAQPPLPPLPPAETAPDQPEASAAVPEPPLHQEAEDEPRPPQALEPAPPPAPLTAAPLTTAPLTAAQPNPPPGPTTASERIAPSTSLEGSARQLVRDDGSLIQPKGHGPLAGLRQRLGS